MRSLLALCLATIAGPLAAAPPSARLESVRYSELVSEVKGLKGKVVLVDVWGTFCPPCKEKFPHVVALHQKFAKEGLAVISVSVDQPDDPDARKAAREFLARHKATFRNVQLSDDAEVWQKKWKAIGPPLLFLYDRKGRLVARWDGPFDAGEVGKKVAALVEE